MKAPVFTREQLLHGIEHHDPEHLLFQKIAARTPPSLTAEELLVVLKWKLGRVKDADGMLVDVLGAINDAICMAGEDGKEVEAIRRLCGCKGVKLAVASTLLTVCYPDKFTIIDRRVLEVLRLTPSLADGWTPERYWGEFVPAVKQYCGLGFSLRDVDRALWGLSVHERIRQLARRGG